LIVRQTHNQNIKMVCINFLLVITLLL